MTVVTARPSSAMHTTVSRSPTVSGPPGCAGDGAAATSLACCTVRQYRRRVSRGNPTARRSPVDLAGAGGSGSSHVLPFLIGLWPTIADGPRGDGVGGGSEEEERWIRQRGGRSTTRWSPASSTP